MGKLPNQVMKSLTTASTRCISSARANSPVLIRNLRWHWPWDSMVNIRILKSLKQMPTNRCLSMSWASTTRPTSWISLLMIKVPNHPRSSPKLMKVISTSPISVKELVTSFSMTKIIISSHYWQISMMINLSLRIHPRCRLIQAAFTGHSGGKDKSLAEKNNRELPSSLQISWQKKIRGIEGAWGDAVWLSL